LYDFCGVSAPGALWSQGDGEIDPYRFTQSVLKQAVTKGIRPFAGTPMTEIQEHDSSVVLSTPNGRITARLAILATGYSQAYYPKHLTTLHTTYALVTQRFAPVTRWPAQCLIWETARPYFYARTLSDGRVMMGGEDTPYPYDHEDHGLVRCKAEALIQRF